MAERVEILVVATDSASQILRGVSGSFGAIGSAIQNLTGGRIIETLTSAIVDFGKQSVDATVKYANEVRNLKMISGESAEETSRFIQVLDDYKISAQDITAAARAMTKEGLVPNLDTLARLSDEYVSISDKQKQNEFIIKNLGRAGLQWVEVLELGSEAIREQGDAVSEGLILNEEMLKQARELEFAQDDWNDTMQEVQLTLGTKVLPTLTDLTKVTLDASKATSEEINGWENLLPPVRAVHTLYIAIRESITGNTEATKEETKANAEMAIQHEKTKEEIKAEEDAIKELTKANEGYLSMIGALADGLTDYERKHEEIQQQLEAGDITLQEAQTAWKQLADEQERSTYRMMLNILQQRLAIDGLDEAETSFLLQQGLEWGIYSQTAVDKANEINRNVDALVSKYRSVPRTVETDIVTNYIENRIGGYVAPASNRAPRRSRAGGGDVMAGILYEVNETRQEFFQPSMSGTVLPLGKNGNGNNQGMVFIYSPQMSLGSQREAETIIMPFVEQAVRRMQSDGRAS